MKKQTIWLLTIIMALTFLGLLSAQITYMSNMVSMRNDQFAEGVRRSLYAVTTTLEQDETKHFLEADAMRFESSFMPRSTSGGAPSSINYSFTTAEGVQGNLTLRGNIGTPIAIGTPASHKDSYRNMQEVLRGQYIYQKGMLDEVILTILNQASNRPIAERADSATVSYYLRTELENNGIMLPFEFAVANRNGALIYHTPGYSSNAGSMNSHNMFVQTLFPNDPQSKMNYLKVYFPSKKDFIFSSIKFMIPSLAFTLILLIIFLYTIIVAFRQKKLTEMKNDFINNMTHEFKTPISTISLAAQMLNDSSVLKSPTMLQHISEVINDETKRLRFQVEKVLQMSMFDRQRATLRLTDVDVNSAIASITGTFKLKVEKYGGQIEAKLAAQDSIVNVDEMHFTNVIFNLLDNAVKYRREDTPLRLTVATRDLPGNRVKIVVEDNGIGIRRDDLKKIFEKFYRVSTGNRHDVKGFGLGLAYVHKMVTEMHGQISVESEPGHGTKFILVFPTCADKE